MRYINIAKGIINSRFFQKPFYAHLFVTRRCNLRCRMCNVWKQKDDREMSLSEIKVAAQKIKKLGAIHIVITGGEPLLRKDIGKIISIFSKLGISTRLQTNGLLLTEKKLDKLIAAGLEDLTVSLDTLDSKKQARICGTKNINVSAQALKMLKLAAREMPKAIVVANTVVSHKNLGEVIDLTKYLDSFGIWITPTVVNLSKKKENYLFKARADDFAFTKSDRLEAKEVYQELLRLKRQGYKIGMSSSYIRQSLSYIKRGNKKWRCDAGVLYFTILPDGQFAVCDEIETKLNILDKNFIQKYKSREFQKHLQSIQKNCEGCFYGCWWETSGLIKSPSVLLDRMLTLINVKKKELLT